MLCHAAEEAPPAPALQRIQIRAACVTDIPALLALIAPGVQAGRVLPRTRRALATSLRDVAVLCRDGAPVAVGQASLIDEALAEIRLLEGGSARERASLLAHMQASLVALGAERILAMTDDPGFFATKGYQAARVEAHAAKWEGQCLRCPRQPLCCLQAVTTTLR